MLTYGFFNSVNGDRVYSAEQMSEMFDGLISDGVFQNVGGAMRVVASNGLNVNVSTGRARINSHWAKVDTAHAITLNSAHVTLNRYTAICLRVDFANREIKLIAIDGTNATAPTKPEPVRNEYYYDMILAYIYVGAGVTEIKQSNIEDTRANTDLCGIVSSLIQNIDTSELYDQYNAAYVEQLDTMAAWFEVQKQAFNTWFNDLTETLNVDTYIERVTESYTTTSESGERFIDIPLSLNYSVTNDILDVFLNGVLLVYGRDYTLKANEVTGGYMVVLPKTVAAGNIFTMYVTRSKIGVRA